IGLSLKRIAEDWRFELISSENRRQFRPGFGRSRVERWHLFLLWSYPLGRGGECQEKYECKQTESLHRMRETILLWVTDPTHLFLRPQPSKDCFCLGLINPCWYPRMVGCGTILRSKPPTLANGRPPS